MTQDHDCLRAIGRLYEFLDHELTEADADDVRAHLAACEPCFDRFGVEESMRSLIRRCCSSARAPETLRVRITQITTVVVREA